MCGCRNVPTWISCDLRNIVTSPVIVHFEYGEAVALATLLRLASCVVPMSCPLEGTTVWYTFSEIGPLLSKDVIALLLFQEKAIRLASQLVQAELSRAENPSPPIFV